MNKFLKFLSGKKGVIATITMTLVAYLATKGMIGETEVILIGTLSSIFFGSASIGTANLYKINKK